MRSGRPVEAEIGLIGDPAAPTAVIEMSAASGMWRIAAGERDIRRASTLGTGEMMRQAVEEFGAVRLLVGIGGSATNDGGAGMAHALGVRFLDRDGRELDPWPGAMAGLASDRRVGADRSAGGGGGLRCRESAAR